MEEQKTLDGVVQDDDFGHHPDRYRELLKSRTPQESSDALERFQRLVSKARQECGIPEVYVVVSLPVQYDGGTSSSVITCFSFGNSLMTESLAAWAFGHEQARRQENIAHVIEQACQAVPRGRRTRQCQAD